MPRRKSRAKSNLELFHFMITKTQTNFNNADRLFTTLLLRQSYVHYIVPPRGIFTLLISSYKALEIHLEIITLVIDERFVERNFIHIAWGLIFQVDFSVKEKKKNTSRYEWMSLATKVYIRNKRQRPRKYARCYLCISQKKKQRKNEKKNKNASFAPTCPSVSRMYLYLLYSSRDLSRVIINALRWISRYIDSYVF